MHVSHWKPAQRAILVIFGLILTMCVSACTSPGVIPPTGQAQNPGTESPSSGATPTAAGGQTAQPTEQTYSGSGPWPITFETSSNVTLAGRLYGDGKVALILAPTYPGGQDGWTAFAKAAFEKGYRSLTFDFEGYGASKGSQSAANAPADIEAALAFLKTHGAEKIILVGAGLGGSASILAADKDSSVQGVALISASRGVEGLQVADDDLSSLKAPSLWLATRNDLTQNVEEMSAKAGSAKKDVWIYEGSSLHGTYIFDGADGPDMQRRLLEFVAAVTG